MEALRNGFEKSMKVKLAQKCSSVQDEEVALTRAFKYFDSDNDGAVTLNEWLKAVERVGVIVPSVSDLKDLFNYYDTNHDGRLDYKEFATVLFSPPAKSAAAAAPAERASAAPAGTEEMLQRIRDKLISRGARGIFGLGKSFRIIDDDNSFTLELSEFKKAMNDYRLGFNEDEIVEMFNVFDINKDKKIQYDEFLRTVRGPMNESRKLWVKRAFNKLDKNGNGKIELDDIKGVYNARFHPDVKSGKRTEDDVLLEFLETFETHHNILMNKAADGIVTPEEFEEYYNNISMSIDNDEYFALMMKNAWKLDEADRTYERGWKGEEEVKAAKGTAPKLSSPSRVSPRKGQTNVSSVDNTLNLGARLYNKMSAEKPKVSLAFEPACELFRKKLAARGARGIIGIGRQFRIMDDDNSGRLSYAEFAKGVQDFRVGVDEATTRLLFEGCDRDKSGEVDYDELLRMVRGPMNEFRKKFVWLAFNKLDKDGNGILEVSDIKDTYSAKNHPDVKAGRKSEEEVLGEFLETFEMHFNLGGGVRDRKITKEEFLEYYNNVSASIDDDQYFELMMVNGWKLHGEDLKMPGWKGEYGAAGLHSGPNKSVGAPYGVSDTPVEYRSAAKVQQETALHGESKASAPAPPATMKEEAKILVHEFRKCLATRGARGIFGIQRVFRIADDDNSGKLSLGEFKKLIKDYRLKMADKDVELLFKKFDRDGSGELDYDEFLRECIGKMNPTRRAIAMKAFAKLDKDGNGVVELADIKGVYSAAKHPDVLSGKRSEDDVLTEFLDTFEQHYSYIKPGQRDGKVTKEEFTEYYNNISVSIDDDKYFELMMTNAWNLDNKPAYGKGWGTQY